MKQADFEGPAGPRTEFRVPTGHSEENSILKIEVAVFVDYAFLVANIKR